MKLFRFAILFGVSALSLGALSISGLHAEQIQLKDGRFIQGRVLESDEEGFKFEITSSKGVVRLAWSQVSERDAKRLAKSVTKSELISLKILVEGVRLTLLDGSQVDGIAESLSDGGWKITNLNYPKGKSFVKGDLEDENSVEEGVKLDAFTIWEATAVIEKELAENPPEDAKAWYRIALIAEARDLYRDALGYLETAIELADDPELKASIEARKPLIEELISQEGALFAIEKANEFVRKKEFGKAIALLKEAQKTLDKDSIASKKMDEILERIDLSFTMQLINDFHDEIPKEISAWTRKNRKATLGDASKFLSSDLTDLVVANLAGANAAENAEVLRRLRLRLGDTDEAVAIRDEIRERKASFTKKGWYEAIGGPLPNSGNMPSPNANNRNGRDGDGVGEIDPAKAGFQASEKSRERRISKEQVEDILKKIASEQQRPNEGKSAANTPAGYDADDPRLQVPKNTPSITDYWDKLSTSGRSKWIHAAFARISPLIWRDESKRSYEVVVFK